MSDNEERDDPQLRSLRAIWLAMPDEEPPERGLAELMAAARVKAEAMAKPSLWDRIVAQLRRPPVLALATVMVLIGGAVLIGTKQSKMEAEPTVVPTSPVQETAPAGESAPAAGSAAPVAPIEVPAAEPAPADPAPPPPPPVKRPRPPAKDSTATAPATDSNKYKAEGDDLRKAEETSLELRDRAEGGKVGAAEKISADGFAGETKGATQPAQTAPAPNNTERARQYVQKAKTALKNNNCEGAKTAMSAARKLDQSVWTEAQRDGKMAFCLSAPVAE